MEAVIKAFKEKFGNKAEEKIIDILLSALDPKTRIDVYLKISEEYYSKALEEINKDLREASEKIWGSCVQVVKAYAEKIGLEHYTHHDLEVVMNKVIKETKDQEILIGWSTCLRFHANFYEGFMDNETFNQYLRYVNVFLDKMKKLINEKG